MECISRWQAGFHVPLFGDSWNGETAHGKLFAALELDIADLNPPRELYSAHNLVGFCFSEP
jgi:hypothetical protein